MTIRNKKAAYVDYQQRSSEFSVGDVVYLFVSGNRDLNGTVQAVYPAIGMVDVEWPHGSERVPVEDLGKYLNRAGDYAPPMPGHDNVPAGAEKVPVPAGPVPKVSEKLASDVAKVYVKKALYWASPDRKYRATKEEAETGNFKCPRCDEVYLRPASYKRENGTSVRLLCCSECLFLVKPCDIENHPDNVVQKLSSGDRVATNFVGR